MAMATTGRRERKKLATRQAIADEAMRLFLQRGYDATTVAEIADAADVAVSTLFKHFRSKEEIAFARDPYVEEELARAVRERPAGTSIAQSLREFLVSSPTLVSGSPEFLALVRATPALSAYSDTMWSRHARAVATAIEDETGVPADDIRLRAWTRALVQIPSLVRDEPDRPAAIDAAIDVLLHGFTPEPPTDEHGQTATPGRRREPRGVSRP